MVELPGVVEKYARFLPVTDRTPRVSLGEGGTPLVPAPRLAERLGSDVRLYLKYEGQNPTGSFKDRGMVVAVVKALEKGARAVICASTGNTSASAAAYAARAGITCIVIVPAGNIAVGKLAQALMYGARVVAVEGNFDAALRLVRQLVDLYPLRLVNSLNPDRIEGQKTAAFEIVDVLGRAPDILALPVGNAGNITAYWKGFIEYQSAGKSEKRPMMLGFQAEGAAPIVLGKPVDQPETVATAIRIGNPASWDTAVVAADESGGRIGAVTDGQILEAQRLLARTEGVFAEPASCAPIAGLLQLAAQGKIASNQCIVAVLTGNGLKDPDVVVERLDSPVTVAPELAAVTAAAGVEEI